MTFDCALLGKNVKRFRVKKELSQEALAELCDISQVHLSLIERGKRMPSVPLLCQLADYLDVSLDELIFADERILRTEKNNALYNNKALLLQANDILDRIIKNL